MRKLLPILLIALSVGGGGAAGLFLKPAPGPAANGGRGDAAQDGHTGTGGGQGGGQSDGYAAGADADHGGGAEEVTERSYVKIGKQTIVPVVADGETRALMLFELAVDVSAGASDRAQELEPRLRDAFLRELFRMSYTGAFMTTFTDDQVIEELRRNLVHAARRYLGDDLKDVLILDVMRQEL